MRKLDEVKIVFDSFKFDLDNGVDQINEHCIQLRNQVDLQTEFVIQKAQEINESLRSEIDKYEANTIETFKRTKLERELDTAKLIDGVEKFHTKTAKYLTEFNLDEKTVEDSLTGAGKIIQDLKCKDMWSMVETKMKFSKNEGKLDDYNKVIGCLVYETTVVNQIEFDKLNLSVIRDFKSHLNLIGDGDCKYNTFYINKDDILSFIILDKASVTASSNNISRPICNATIANLKVVSLDDAFFVGFKLTQPNQRFCFGNRQFLAKNNLNFIMKVDSDFCFNSVISMEYSIEFMAASKSYLLIIESDKGQSPSCLLFCSHLKKRKRVALRAFLTHDETLLDVKLNETHIFFLCSTNKLKIFDLRTLVIVKEITVKADQIELVSSLSSSIIVLFDSATQNIVRYNQCGGFERLDAHNNLQLQQQQFDTTGLKLVCDCPNYYSLYSLKFSS
jgi:hypothetical protein